MNQRAAEELWNAIMLDEVVARREAVNQWSRRWIATLHCESTIEPCLENVRGQVLRQERGRLQRDMFRQLALDPLCATIFGHPAGDDGKPQTSVCVLEMHVVLQEPRGEDDLDPVSDATRQMLGMARGGGK